MYLYYLYFFMQLKKLSINFKDFIKFYFIDMPISSILESNISFACKSSP